MKYFAFAVVLMGFAWGTRPAAAQDFFYVPPGYGPNYYYGLDFGNGVGFGYGLGIGVPLPPQAYLGSVTPAAIPPQPLWDDGLPQLYGSGPQFDPGNVMPTHGIKSTKQKPKQMKLQKVAKVGKGH